MATFGPRFFDNLQRRAPTCPALSEYLHSGRDSLLNGLKVLCTYTGSTESGPSGSKNCEVDFLPGHSTITLEFNGDTNGDAPTAKTADPDLSQLTEFTQGAKDQIDMVDLPARVGGVKLDCAAITAFSTAIGGFGRYISHMNNNANLVMTCRTEESVIAPAITTTTVAPPTSTAST